MPEDTRKVLARIRKERGRVTERKGKGDHLNFKVDGQRKLITIDTGRKKMSDKTYREIVRIMGWDE